MTTAPDVSGKLLPPCNHRRSGQGPTAQPCSIAQNTIGCVDRHSVPPHTLPISCPGHEAVSPHQAMVLDAEYKEVVLL